MVRHRFFEGNIPGTQQNSNMVVMDFGGNGDCGFRVIAGLLLFNFSKENNSYKERTLQKILDNFYTYYPAFKPDNKVHAKEHLNALLKHQPIDQLIAMFAFVLRQLSVDEMCSNVEIYRGAFVANSEGTSPAQMRKNNTWIDESAIAALAMSLDIPVEVVDKGQGRALGRSYVYNQTASDTKITMQLQSGHYKGVVKAQPNEVEHFRGSRKSYTPPMISPIAISRQDPSFEEIIAKCNSYDQKVLNEFNQLKDNLTFKFKVGELNKEKLVQMYIGAMKNSDYLQGRHIVSIKESGNESFFNTINDAQAANKNGITINYPETQLDSVVEELIHAISRACVIDQANLEELFQYMEESSQKVKTTRARSQNTQAVSQKNVDEVVQSPSFLTIRG